MWECKVHFARLSFSIDSNCLLPALQKRRDWILRAKLWVELMSFQVLSRSAISLIPALLSVFVPGLNVSTTTKWRQLGPREWSVQDGTAGRPIFHSLFISRFISKYKYASPSIIHSLPISTPPSVFLASLLSLLSLYQLLPSLPPFVFFSLNVLSSATSSPPTPPPHLFSSTLLIFLLPAPSFFLTPSLNSNYITFFPSCPFSTLVWPLLYCLLIASILSAPPFLPH